MPQTKNGCPKSSVLYVHAAEFYVNQAKRIGRFERVFDSDDMERIVVREGIGDRVNSVHTLIGWNQLANHYGPFLVLKLDARRDGRREYLQLKAIDPSSGDELFVAERYLDRKWAGVTDRNTRYPLFNAFLDWLDKNS